MAHNLGLNVSKITENALVEMINRLSKSNGQTNFENGLSNVMAGGARFELATTGLGGLRPVRTRLPAL